MKIYNSKTRQKETFVPIKEGYVNIYSCGPTVYNYFHIGNARPFIVFDVLRRYLSHIGYKVKFVQNFTDIDDKVIRKANEENKTIRELTDFYINEYFKDAHALYIKDADVHPRATEHINEIINLIQQLIDLGYAYQTANGVYFSVKNNKNYGCLCGQHLDDLESGARISVDNDKKSPLDFVLWKTKKENEPYWESPFGQGRPGWHIECSAMAMKYLGETIDIHCGGKDLLFPHHENEIAQSECATGKKFVNYWMHNGFINVDNEKMSKSKGNFFTVRDISEKYDLEVVRMFMLLVHYRNPINFSEELIKQAESSLNRLYNSYQHLEYLLTLNGLESDESYIDLKEYKDKFYDAMDDDLNTSDALSVLFEISKQIFTLNTERINRNELNQVQKFLDEAYDILGLLNKETESIPKHIKDILEQRKQARINKDFLTSDRLRDCLKEEGYLVEDTKDGQKLKKL